MARDLRSGSSIGKILPVGSLLSFLRGYLTSQLAIIGTIPALFVSTFFTAIMHESRGKFWILLSVFTGLFYGLAFIMTDSLLPSFFDNTWLLVILEEIQA